MRCAWQPLLSILPPWLRQQADGPDRDATQEIRLRLNAPPELVQQKGSRWLGRNVTQEDITFCVNAASRYSPWSASTVAKGYITAPGGHRIGICGEAVTKGGAMCGIREVHSLCIRIARDMPGIAAKAAGDTGSILIIGAPGWGKTTLLRDLIRQISEQGAHVGVVDTRGELFPSIGGFFPGKCTDVISGCGKGEGIDMVLRTMGPQYVAVDEITDPSDCEALLRTGWCGVRLLATAHAASLRDLNSRTVYRPLVESRLFPTVLVMKQDKSWTLERMDI